MAVKGDLYSVHEGRKSGLVTNVGKGGPSGGKFAGHKGKLGNIDEGPQSNSVAMVTKKKKLQDLKKKSWAEGKKLKKMQMANK